MRMGGPLDSRLVGRNARAAEARIGDEAIVLHLDHGRYFRLNSTGIWIWEQIAEPVAPADLVARLGRRFDLSDERARADLEAFLTGLSDRDLLAREPAQGAAGGEITQPG